MPDHDKPDRNPDETVQLRIAVTQAQYDMLKAQARRQGISVAKAVRQLMEAGIMPFNRLEAMDQRVDRLERYIHLHLEPLTFIAAMDSAFNAANWEQQAWLLHERQAGGDKAQATAPYQKYQRSLRQRATKRLQRKLRNFDASEFDDSETEGEAP